jgi:hypothetical protein
MGSAEEDSPSVGGLRVSPNFKFPQDWGIQGVEKTLLISEDRFNDDCLLSGWPDGYQTDRTSD